MFRARSFTALAAVFALIAVATPASAQQQSPEMQKVAEAEQLVNQGKPDDALKITEALLTENPELAAAYFVAGLAYQAKGRSAADSERMSTYQSCYDNFVKATEYNPGWGMAHRLASMCAADTGNLEASWDQAIKAHQSGTDMSDAFAGLPAGDKPSNFDELVSVKRVFVGPLDTENFEQQGDTALAGGANSSASGRTDVGRRVIQEAASDIFTFQQEARRQIAGSRAFGLVQRQDLADLILVFEVDSIADRSRRQMEGVMKLVDAKSGEELYRRRFDFANIASRGDLNRDFAQYIRLMEEWAKQQRG